MEPADVTVLIPCNNIRFLEEALASIKSQSLQPKLVLVILNGEARNTNTEILSKLTLLLMCETQFIISERDGIVPALNLGLTVANTKYIARLDSDDLMLPNRLENQINFLEDHPDVVAVGGQVLDYENRKVRFLYPTEHSKINTALYRFTGLPHPGVTYLLSFVKRVGSYSQKFEHVEDWDLWVRLSRVGKLANLSVPVIYYRSHELQVTNSIDAKKMIGQSRLTKKRFLNSVSDFGNQCGCLSCLSKRESLNTAIGMNLGWISTVQKYWHGSHYSVSCLGGYLYIEAKRFKLHRPLLGIFLLTLCGVLKPGWALSSLKRRTITGSISK